MRGPPHLEDTVSPDRPQSNAHYEMIKWHDAFRTSYECPEPQPLPQPEPTLNRSDGSAPD